MRSGWLFWVYAVLASFGAAAKDCTPEPVSFDYDQDSLCFVEERLDPPIFERDGRIFLRKEGREIQVTNGPADTAPILWPDGKGFYFFRPPRGGEADNIALHRLMSQTIGGKPQAIGTPQPNPVAPAYSADGRQLYFLAALTGPRGSLIRLDRQSGIMSTVANGFSYFLMKNCRRPINPSDRNDVVVIAEHYRAYVGEYVAATIYDKAGRRRGLEEMPTIADLCSP